MAEKFINVIIPALPTAFCYIDRPDDKAPEGAAWQPSNKFKYTGIADNVQVFDSLKMIIVSAASAKWADRTIDWDSFAFPWTENDDDVRQEQFRGKTTINASSKNKPDVVDCDKPPKKVPENVKVFGGDIVKSNCTLYLYEKTEKVKVGKKLEDVMILGCSLRLNAVQLIEKRSGGGGYSSAFEDVADGYVADTSSPAAGTKDPSGPVDANDGDF